MHLLSARLHMVAECSGRGPADAGKHQQDDYIFLFFGRLAHTPTKLCQQGDHGQKIMHIYIYIYNPRGLITAPKSLSAFSGTNFYAEVCFWKTNFCAEVCSSILCFFNFSYFFTFFGFHHIFQSRIFYFFSKCFRFQLACSIFNYAFQELMPWVRRHFHPVQHVS